MVSFMYVNPVSSIKGTLTFKLFKIKLVKNSYIALHIFMFVLLFMCSKKHERNQKEKE